MLHPVAMALGCFACQEGQKSAPPYGQATPYLPVRDILRQVCGLAEGDAAAGHMAALQHRLHASGMTAEEDVALLLHLLDLPVELDAWPGSVPRRGRSAPLRSCGTWSCTRRSRSPWCWWSRICTGLTPRPQPGSCRSSSGWRVSAILLVGTCGPGAPLLWGAHAAGTQVALPPLRESDSRTMRSGGAGHHGTSPRCGCERW